MVVLGARKFFYGFGYAWDGIVHSLKTQPNMRIHFTAALLVLGSGFYLGLNPRDLLFLFFAITLVIMAEMFNTAIEAAVDLYVKDFHPLAKIAKNVAAGAVLVTALNSLAVAYIILYPSLKNISINQGALLKSTALPVALAALLVQTFMAVAGVLSAGRVSSKGVEDGMEFSTENLIKAATEAREKAYAPYSKFRVGAALLTRTGRCYTGCNVENVSYGLTCCAERVALFKAVSEGERDFSAIAITAGTGEYCTPCGACRQALAEFGRDLKVLMANKHGKYRVMTVAELLPAAFEQNTLTSQ